MEGVRRLGADHRPSPRHRTFTIKEGKNALTWARLSCRRFRDNQARLPLFALACNLGNFLPQLTRPRPVRTWTLTTGPSILGRPQLTVRKIIYVAVATAATQALIVLPPYVDAAREHWAKCTQIADEYTKKGSRHHLNARR